MKDSLVTDVPYFMVPNAVFSLGLPVNELAVFCYLYRCGNNGKTAFPSYATIGSCCGISRLSAIRAVKELIRKRLIEKETRSGLLGFSPNLYRVSNLEEFS